MAAQGHHLYMGGLFLNVDGDTEKKNFTRFNLQTKAFERVPGVTNAFAGKNPWVFARRHLYRSQTQLHGGGARAPHLLCLALRRTPED